MNSLEAVRAMHDLGCKVCLSMMALTIAWMAFFALRSYCQGGRPR